MENEQLESISFKQAFLSVLKEYGSMFGIGIILSLPIFLALGFALLVGSQDYQLGTNFQQIAMVQQTGVLLGVTLSVAVTLGLMVSDMLWTRVLKQKSEPLTKTVSYGIGALFIALFSLPLVLFDMPVFQAIILVIGVWFIFIVVRLIRLAFSGKLTKIPLRTTWQEIKDELKS